MLGSRFFLSRLSLSDPPKEMPLVVVPSAPCCSLCWHVSVAAQDCSDAVESLKKKHGEKAGSLAICNLHVLIHAFITWKMILQKCGRAMNMYGMTFRSDCGELERETAHPKCIRILMLGSLAGLKGPQQRGIFSTVCDVSSIESINNLMDFVKDKIGVVHYWPLGRKHID